jgi:hypothetical protein
VAKGFKIKTNFSYKKLARKLPDILSDSLNVLGNHINKAIQDGIDSGRDINDKTFEPLSTKSTLPMRNRDGYGFSPLKLRGHLRKTKKTPATDANPVFKIEMVGKSQKTLPLLAGKKVNRKNPGVVYGAFHNQKGGYRTSPKSAIPNKKVPQRKWFGIPDSALPGGSEYKKASLNRKFRIAKALKTMMK